MTRQTATTTAVRAACLRCHWTATEANAQGIAAQHHDRTGHPVNVELTRIITYGDPSAAPAGQELLDLEAATP